MKLVVDAVGVRAGSAAIVIGNVLRGWTQVAPDDDLVVLTDGPAHFDVPPGVRVHAVVERDGTAARLWAQSIGVRRACRHLGADALLSAVTAGAFLGGARPSAAIVYDVRHELHPEQFPRGRRIARRLLYGWTFRRADALFCISARTRDDLVRTRPRLAVKARATLLGADHAAGWKPPEERSTGAYALAFGHFQNKNLDAVLRAFARVDPAAASLRVCGLPAGDRPRFEQLVADLGLGDRVELLGWLTDEEFASVFAGAAVIVFPSDFEGFGLPVVEAMLLGIPVVVSRDPALLEVSGGHAVISDDPRPATLAAAVAAALHRSPEQRSAARAHARSFTWSRTAGEMRAALLELPRPADAADRIR